MTRVKKGGREYLVDDSRVDEYLAQGYNVIDARGNVIRNGGATNYDVLLVENSELKQAVKRLEASNKELASQLESKTEEYDKAKEDFESQKEEFKKRIAEFEAAAAEKEKKNKAKADAKE